MYGVVSFFSSRDCKFSKSSISCKILASFPYFPGDVSLEVIPADDGDALLMLFRPLRSLMPFLSEEGGCGLALASVPGFPFPCTDAVHFPVVCPVWYSVGTLIAPSVYPRRLSGVLSGLLAPLHRQASSDLRFRNMVFSVNQISDLLLFRA